MKSKNGTDKYTMLTTHPIPGVVCKMAIPTVISMLVTSFYNMVDTYFVGRLDNTSATGAVGVAFSLMMLIQAVGFFFGHGSGNYISRKLGAKEEDEAYKMASTGFFLSFIVGIFIAASGLLFLKPLVLALGSTETILPFAMDYIEYILIATPFMTASLVLNNQLRFQGNAFYAMIGIVSGAALNILLDEIFMFRLGLGISGAAIATGLSQIFSFFLLLIGVMRSGSVKISIKNFKPNAHYVKEIFRGGVPSLCRQGISTFSTVSLNFVAGAVGGDAAVAAFSIVNRISMFANSALIGFGQGFQPVCGFNYGAKKYSRVEYAYKFCIKYSFFFLIGMSALVFIFAPELVTLFRKNDLDVIRIGTLGIRLQSVVFPLNSVIVLSNMLLQSVGKAVKASILAASRNGLFFIPLVFILGYTCGILGLQLTQPICDVLTFGISLPFGRSFMKEMRCMERENAINLQNEINDS